MCSVLFNLVVVVKAIWKHFSRKRYESDSFTVISWCTALSYFFMECGSVAYLSNTAVTFLLPGADYSPGIRFKATAAILAVGQRLLSYNTITPRIFDPAVGPSAPGYYTFWGTFSWRAVKAGCPGNLIFASVINWILLLTLAGEFSNLLLVLTWIPEKKSLSKKMQMDKLLLFRIKKW